MPSEKVKSPGNWIIPFICRHDAVQGGQGGVLPPPPLTSPRPEPGRGLWAQRASAGRCMPALLSLTCLVSDRPWGPSPRPELGGGGCRRVGTLHPDRPVLCHSVCKRAFAAGVFPHPGNSRWGWLPCHRGETWVSQVCKALDAVCDLPPPHAVSFPEGSSRG